MAAAVASDSEPQLTWEDQERINLFGRLNNRADELDELIKINKKRLDGFSDAEESILLADSDEAPVRYRLGEVFVEMPADKATEMLTAATEKVTAEVNKQQEEVASIRAKMVELKRALYAKLGDTINLESGDDE
ncbi:hypothetical protein CAOG_06825 [Capsaspora owczarzaki ATCC 30864]|uniref:hypothetical protein n=1 Tax=Capsaspora owczarzaki (strain ATCC 30864) TaxID=595528 RepID=UPI0001FE2BE8|nr:hypothetical protein CAOG_06825 [Capsaspora owczarzaki ATCC 30864]|eukprot:XP_004344446.1 hypothetical protein CAOG_06825 [Capsaspora owczarzaki ATCC 30864]